MKHMTHLVLMLVAIALPTVASANTYYVATNGNDANAGGIANPFASFNHAISLANPGDTIYVRGGTYMLDSTININKSGTQANPIKLWAMPGENPILNFANNPRHANLPQPRTDDSIAATGDALGIFFAGGANGGNWWHLKGLTVEQAPYYGVRIYGSNNIIEQMTLRQNSASGLEITGKEGFSPSYNLVLNSDSYLNFDPQTSGEDADGFAAKFDTAGPGNVFRGTRAWGNSDDGYDFWHIPHTVLIDNTWAFHNGYNVWGASGFRGDGNGFKLGQDSGAHILTNNLAWDNRENGFDINGNDNPAGVELYNNTGYDNHGRNFAFSNGSYPHVLLNNISYSGDVADSFGSGVIQSNNSWNSGIGGVNAADFLSLLDAIATGPRNPDGSLPISDFLRLVADSNLVDAGVDVGLLFYGLAPDLGAYEVVIPEPASASLALGGCLLLLRPGRSARRPR